jgi:hypothetical protein
MRTAADLERMLVRQLLVEYRRISWAYFKSALSTPTIALVNTSARLGAWRPKERTIEISRPLVFAQPWGVVVEVLKHEMAHQYAHEVLGATDETAHGPAFRSICERLGIDRASSGLPRAAHPEEDRVVAKVARLLALAESPNIHEAEAAMAAAQRLMLKHNVEHAGSRSYDFKQLGTPTGRTTESQRLLAMILGKYFFVEVIWVPVYRPLEGKHGSVLEICGTPENLAMAEYAHDFLLHTAERLWEEHAKKTKTPRRERQSYLSGVMTGFAEKLARQTRASASEGLVWVRDADLESYYKKRHPHVRYVRYSGVRRTSAWDQGKQAGSTIVLHKPMGERAASHGHLLPRGKS